MERIKVHDKYFKLFIPNEKIEKSIAEVADKINKDYADCEDVPIFVCVLNGAFMFASSLLKNIDFDCELTFVKYKSYVGTKSSGKLERVFKLSTDVKNRKVIIVEDIVDTGGTINQICEDLREAGASDVQVATLFLKPNAYHGNEEIKYNAMSIGNEFIVGFGLDYDQLGRQYKDIYIIDE